MKLTSEDMISLEWHMIHNLIAIKGDEERQTYNSPVDNWLMVVAKGAGCFLGYYCKCARFVSLFLGVGAFSCICF
jgi:hypothetical protein